MGEVRQLVEHGEVRRQRAPADRQRDRRASQRQQRRHRRRPAQRLQPGRAKLEPGSRSRGSRDRILGVSILSLPFTHSASDIV